MTLATQFGAALGDTGEQASLEGMARRGTVLADILSPLKGGVPQGTHTGSVKVVVS
jgi:hypothetical protein